MNTLNHYSFDSISDLSDRLNAYAEAGIDPAFDSDCEEWGITWTTLETVADDLFPEPTSHRRRS
jgi:hypothetical protein